LGDQQGRGETDVGALRARLAEASPAGDPERALAALEAIEQKLRLEAGAGCNAAELTADLRHWQRLCQRFGLEEQAERAAAELEHLVSYDLEQWSDSARATARRTDPDPDALLEALDRAIGLSFELRGARDANDAARQRLETDRSELRAVFEGLAPDAAPREVQQGWTTRWIDRAAMVLAEADDAPPQGAAQRLREVADELAWLAGCLGGGRPRRQLKRKARRLYAEAQERALQARLEHVFGSRVVTGGERVVLWLTFFVLGLLALEATVTFSPQTRFWFLVADTTACGVFLLEYFTKVALAEGRLRWALRHFLTDLVPSIPFGLFLGEAADALRAGRLSRLLRLPRLLRYIRLLRPVMRGFRALALLARGFDRLVRRYGRLLNHNVILYPTEAELARAGEGGGVLHPPRQVQLEARGRWQTLVAAVEPDERAHVADRRLQSLVAARSSCHFSPFGDESEAVAREIPAGVLLRRLERLQPETVEAVLGPETMAQAARAVRLLASTPIRYLPVIGRCLPRQVSKDEDDGHVLARAAQRTARFLKRIHDGWFWLADLYGTVTPSQFVDRVGGVLVKSSFRPAYRLAIAAGGLLLVQLLLQIASNPLLQQARQYLFNFAGIPVMVVGGVCMVLVGIGWWFQTLAKEATEFYERSAKAQFLALTDEIRKRTTERDGRALYERVLRPHHRVAGVAEDRDAFTRRLRGALADPAAATADEADERLLMLHRDWSDGAPLTESDTRATSQLLGDPTMQEFIDRAARVDADEQKKLQELDLERQKGLVGGPYLWFNLIARAVSHSVAGLLVEYNRYAIPVDELERVSAEHNDAYQRWLASEQSGAEAATTRDDPERGYMTTAFTALHFLDADPERDAAVERRFGSVVRQRLERDRQLMIRRIFGTWPLHEQPKATRTVNLYNFYERWFAGGRALLMPLWILGLAFAVLKRGLKWLIRAVREIYQPERRGRRDDAGRADFATAARKINRIHGPMVETTIRLRARLDPEYLGFAVPGHEPPSDACASVDGDLAFYRAEAELREVIDRERRRTASEMARLRDLIASGLLARAAAAHDLADGAFETARHRRAAAVIYTADVDSVRSLLSGAAVLRAIAGDGTRKAGLAAYASPRLRTRRRFRRFVTSQEINTPEARGALWRAVLGNDDGAADALAAWAVWGEDAPREGERRLAEQLMRVTRIGEQLLTLRAIQTMSLLDVVHYRAHIHRLGDYGDQAARDEWVRSSLTRPDEGAAPEASDDAVTAR
jgi:hypothetical protein